MAKENVRCDSYFIHTYGFLPYILVCDLCVCISYIHYSSVKVSQIISFAGVAEVCRDEQIHYLLSVSIQPTKLSVSIL